MHFFSLMLWKSTEREWLGNRCICIAFTFKTFQHWWFLDLIRFKNSSILLCKWKDANFITKSFVNERIAFLLRCLQKTLSKYLWWLSVDLQWRFSFVLLLDSDFFYNSRWQNSTFYILTSLHLYIFMCTLNTYSKFWISKDKSIFTILTKWSLAVYSDSSDQILMHSFNPGYFWKVFFL